MNATNSIALISKLIFPSKENFLIQLVTTKKVFTTKLPAYPLMNPLHPLISMQIIRRCMNLVVHVFKSLNLPSFHLPQFEHELFLQYLSRLNDYCAQYMHSMYEKWKICNVVLEGTTHKTRANLESICYGG